MQPNDKIKELFSSKLANFEPSPPLGMWAKIDDSLSVGFAKQMPVRKVALWKVISVASGIAAMVAIAFLLLTYTHEDNTLAGKPVIDKSNTTIDEPVNTPEPVSAQATVKQPLYAKAFIHPNRRAKTAEHEAAANKKSEYAPSDEPPENRSVRQQEEDIPGTNRSADENLKKKIEAFEKAGQNNVLEPDAGKSKTSRKKGISLSVSGSSGFSELADKKVLVPAKFMRYALMADANQEMVTTVASLYKNRSVWPSPRVKIEHRQPISFGLKIDKRLNNRFSVETGLVCTYLSSKLTPSDPNYKMEGDLKFYYIGFPVSLNYTFARLGAAEFQFSAGGMLQKDISGKIVGDQKIKDLFWHNENEGSIIEDHISDKISQDNLQLSIMANAGVSYPLYKILNVYATVGGAYYFDAENEFRTVYLDKRLQLDVNVGLKLKF